MVRGNGKRRKSMNRKSKLFFSLVSLCFSIAVLCFGVYSALSVSYSISGSVSYEINDVFVELDLSVYRALSTTPVNSATHNQNVSTIKDAGDNISETDFGKLSYTDHESTYEGGEVKPGNEYGIFEADSPNLALTYGSPTNDNQGYAFYIVIDIHNLGSEIINAQIKAPTSLENTILLDSGNVEITADGTERIVLGLALDDVTKGITSADFTYTITISRGGLPIEPITDMEFSIDEATKTATLRSYGGSGVDVVIPESIGYGTGSSVALTLESMEDMTSNEMNMMYFYQDLYITLPNQKTQLIENPLLWRNENADAMEATPENYFPMTIQTVESYTIDEVDYAEFNQKMASNAALLAFAPIQMIMENALLTSVHVQYGTNGQSFTFNMENYNAYTDGDDSTIDDFMSKMESDPKSLLPVTYSNFEYNVLVKGGEYSVTSIGSYAFYSDLVICNLYIPNTITSIESSAFGSIVSSSIIENVYAEDLDTLLNIDYDFIPSSNASSGSSIISLTNPFCIADNVYINGELLPEEITIEDGLTEIKPGTLAGLDTVKTINIPSSVTSIGADAFYICSNLSSVYIDGQAVANMLTGTNDAGGLLGNIDTSEKVYINNTLTLTGGAKTYMESNFEIVTSDVSGYVCYQKK